ncbi:hypothetical protein K239x_14450 [Planctomycetes bacterium K23_9]|uniref:Uncharacterized protein n=1 Tax=Stieleria marina TaxID=1930275 RepID=A0A517NQV0_9BACT|nr:hypothetical protein K239x_14450 [Planctomycetes bacterium K23_9]
MQLELFVYEGQGSRRVWVTLAMPPPYGWIGALVRRPINEAEDGGGLVTVHFQHRCLPPDS